MSINFIYVNNYKVRKRINNDNKSHRALLSGVAARPAFRPSRGYTWRRACLRRRARRQKAGLGLTIRIHSNRPSNGRAMIKVNMNILTCHQCEVKMKVMKRRGENVKKRLMISEILRYEESAIFFRKWDERYFQSSWWYGFGCKCVAAPLTLTGQGSIHIWRQLF